VKKNTLEFSEIVDEAYLAFAEQAAHNKSRSLAAIHEYAFARTIEASLSALYDAKGLNFDGLVKTRRLTAVNRLEVAMRELVAKDKTDGGAAAKVGASFEQLSGKCIVKNAQEKLEISTSSEQRSGGVYFTPPELAEAMLEPALRNAFSSISSIQELRQVSILDPAVGCGSFLLAAIRIGAKILGEKQGFSKYSNQLLKSEIARFCLYGVDIDPIAIATVRSLIIAEIGDKKWKPLAMDRHLKVGDAICSSLADWRSWFPSRKKRGFSVIVTNPPWSKLRPLRHEFFEHIDERVRLYQGSDLGRYLDTHLSDLVKAGWNDHVNKTILLSNNLKNSTEYRLNSDSSGDPDLYKYFVERSVALLADDGIASLLLPSGVLRAQGSAALRRLIFEQGEVLNLVEYINRRKIFDIHSMYRFCSIQFKKGRRGGILNAKFGVEDIKASDNNAKNRLSIKYLSAVGGVDSLIPEVRTPQERDLLLRLYKTYPTAATVSGHWAFKFNRELDMTNDSSAFIESNRAIKDGYERQADGRWLSKNSAIALLPLYEGRMVHQYDCVAKLYVHGQGRSAKWRVPRPEERQIFPHYFVPEPYAISRGWQARPRAAYCEISGHANERTVLAAMIPPFAVCGNKVPVLNLYDESYDSHLLWLALANSLVVDWLMRRWVSTTINQFYWRNIPLPPRSMSKNNRFLIGAAKYLIAHDELVENSDVWYENRAKIRAAIDAVVLDIYGVTDEELNVILEDFPAFRVSHKRHKNNVLSFEELIAKARQAHRSGNLNLKSIIKASSGYASA
jgi:hypothetical protein